MIKLVCSDGGSVEVEEAVALRSQTLKNIIEDGCANDGIRLPEVTSKILPKVIAYCKKHVDAACEEENQSPVDRFCRFLAGKPTIKEELETWDQDFLKGLDEPTLCDLLLAANFLNIKELLDLTRQPVADKIKGKTIEELNEMLNLPKGLTKEEEGKLEEIRSDKLWLLKE